MIGDSLLSKGLIIANLGIYLLGISFLAGTGDLHNQIDTIKTQQASLENRLSGCSIEKTNQITQLSSCNYTNTNSQSELTTLQHDYSVCQTDLSAALSKYSSCSSSLLLSNSNFISCSSRLARNKNSYCGIYSLHMHSSDVSVQSIAVTAKAQEENFLSNPANALSKQKQIANTCASKLGNVGYTRLIGAMGSYYWLVNNVVYLNTPFSTTADLASTYMRNDTVVLQVKAGQCNEQALSLASMLRSQGIEAEIVHLNIPAPYCTGSCYHAITIAHISGLSSCQPGWSYGTDTILLDPTWKGEFGTISYMNANIKLEIENLIEIPNSLR